VHGGWELEWHYSSMQMYSTIVGLHILVLMMCIYYYHAGSPKQPFLNQLSLSIVVPIVILAIILLSLVFVMVTIAVIIKKSWQRAKDKILQTQVMDTPSPESSIFEEIIIDFKPEQIMEENMAYNTVQEFQERENSEAIPESQLDTKPEQIMEENMAYNTEQKFQEREKSEAIIELGLNDGFMSIDV
jgi:hypothetical protein